MGTIWTNSDSLRVHYGTRVTGDEANFGEALAPSGVKKTLALSIRGSDFASNVYTGPSLILPNGATVRNIVAEVVSVFVLGGTTPGICVGVSGSEATNALVKITQTQAQATGSYSLSTTGAGTLAQNTPLATRSTLDVILTGTTPTVTKVGQILVYVEYDDANAVT